MNYTQYYFCPNCDWELPITEEMRRCETTTCPCCRAALQIDTDGDDGRDATRLFVITSQKRKRLCAKHSASK